MGVTVGTIAMLYERSGGRCEICGTASSRFWSKHHRQPRGMGGTSLPVHGASNILVLCGSGTEGCHGYVEAHREEAYEKGWLVRRGMVPAETPVFIRQQYAPRGAWVLLDDLGGATAVDSPEPTSQEQP